MKVTEKLTLRDYFRDPRFAVRAGNEFSISSSTSRFALVSNHYFYLGADGPLLNHDIGRAGRGMRTKFEEGVVEAFIDWA